MQYTEAIYHVIVMLNRVERCELIFRDDHDRQLYLETLGETRGLSTCVGEMPMTLDWFRGDPGWESNAYTGRTEICYSAGLTP